MEGTTGFHRINVADIDRLNGLAPIGHLCIALLNNSIEDLSGGIAKSTAEYCTYRLPESPKPLRNARVYSLAYLKAGLSFSTANAVSTCT